MAGKSPNQMTVPARKLLWDFPAMLVYAGDVVYGPGGFGFF
jgi:hypothetical protein